VRSPLFDRAIGQARRAVTSAAASIDQSVVRWTQRRIEQTGATSARVASHHGNASFRDRLAEISLAYGTHTNALPSRFFPIPEPSPLHITSIGDGPERSRIWDLAQASSYQPYWSGIADPYLTLRDNLTSHARWWRCPRPGGADRKPAPVIVVIHGWRGGAYWMSERVFEIPYWIHHGFDVIAFQLPFHGRRAPQDRGRRGGELFLTRNIARTNEAFGHAVYDLRSLAASLRQHHGVPVIGALGMSLGGYTAALWASVCDDLDFAVAMIPAVALHTLMWRTQPRSQRASGDHGGEELAALEQAFAVHSPLARPVRIAADRLFVIAGDGDRITPADQAQALIDHWRCESHWFAGGHLAQVGRHQALRAARLHLNAGGMSGE
jgi:pimeloyl-ACP methyl ester carboxylesterase